MIVINQNEEETMQYIKLQLGCLLVILYIMAAYVKATKHEKMSCNRIYDALMAVTPLAVIFDGITVWTINHMDIVPGIVNRAAHLIFYILMDLEILITALYMYDQTVGLSKQNRKKNLRRRMYVLRRYFSIMESFCICWLRGICFTGFRCWTSSRGWAGKSRI